MDLIDDAIRQDDSRAFEIRQVRELSAEESHDLFAWGENIFGTDLNLTYRPKNGEEVRFVLYDAGHPVSHAAVLRHHARANGRPVLIGGIGGVVTNPAAHRRGHAARLVQHATTLLREEWKVDFALLFCIDRMKPYYERLAWRKLECEVLIDQPTGEILSPFHVMTMSFTPEFETINSIDLDSASW
jgi:GNAT superfamily N-acetyltransferase